MIIKGINYDTGFISAGTTTREPFDPLVVRREMQIIHDDLHCNAVRVTGGYAERLEIAAACAVEAGLAVWFCPFTNDLNPEEVLDLLAGCAERAERLRLLGADIVFLTGSELSLFTLGLLPGATLPERMAQLADPQRVPQLIPALRARVKELLSKAVEIVRSRFGGKVSYASLPFEDVDWGQFDIISTDAGYRTGTTAGRFREDMRAFVAYGRAREKPVAITEFGCATYKGAGDLGDRDDSIIEWGPGARPVRLKRAFTRDEVGQAEHIREVLEIFEAEGVDAAFVYTFARYDLRDWGGAEDFDLVSKGVVRVLGAGRGERYPDLPWEPKAAFLALGEWYKEVRQPLPAVELV